MIGLASIAGRERPFVRGLALAALLSGLPAPGTAQDTPSERERLYGDVFATITLAGFHCGAVRSVTEEAPSDYTVACRNGKRYRVHSPDAESVRIVDQTPGVQRAPVERDDHGARISRSLFAIVNLLGHDCDEVVSIERGPRLHYRVWCRNDAVYRISVLEDGRVAVQRQR